MTEATEQLIAHLAADAAPVRRLRPPAWRALLWLIAVAIAATVAVYFLSDLGGFVRRAEDGRQAIELAATLATGILAILAAFHLSLPDRSSAWMLVPLPTLALWLATAGYGCLGNWFDGVPSHPTESMDCFQIIVGVSIPLGITALWMLRRAKPLAAARVATLGGLGVAAMSAFLLQFFHPFDVTIIDLGVHAAAVAVVVGVSALSARI